MRKSSLSVPSSRSVLLNPKFGSSMKPTVHINPKFSNVHVNPNFTGRALPPVPHLNPEFLLDPSKAASYRESIQRAVEISSQKSLSLRSEAPTGLLSAVPEKENRTPAALVDTPGPSSSTSSFKKIGQRKLIRIRGSKTPKDDVPTPNKAISSSSFKKIGSRKLIRIRGGKKEDALKRKSSPVLVYKVKTPPPPKKMSLSHRFMRRRSSPNTHKTPFSKILQNPFKLDKRRRRTSKITSPLKTPPKTPHNIPRNTLKNSPSPRSKKIGEETYLVTTTSMKKLPPPPKPARSTAPTPVRHQLITVQGVKYNVSDNGRKLHRVEAGALSAQKPPTNFGVSKKLFLEGEEYVEDEPGVLVRSRNSMTRQSITNYRNRSINTIIKSQTRAKQYCMFYNKFGKCNKREKGVCPYIHDPEKVAVCRKFLMGNCLNDKCLLSHEVAPDKMPSCKFFLEGLCSRDNCPYRHIKVNATAETCLEFMKGFCSEGQDCKKQHTYLCSEFANSGTCSNKDACRLPHVANVALPSSSKTPGKVKKVAPVKPKRKSLGNTPMASASSGKKARLRYYDEGDIVKAPPHENIPPAGVAADPEDEDHTSEYVLRRKRIMKKVELAKQGWTGVARVEDNPVDLDDSGPYVEIDEEEPSRPPVGELPSFISLSRYASSEEEDEEAPTSSSAHPETRSNTAQEEDVNNYEERLI